MAPFLLPNPTVLRRLMEELGNVLVGVVLPFVVLIGFHLHGYHAFRLDAQVIFNLPSVATLIHLNINPL